VRLLQGRAAAVMQQVLLLLLRQQQVQQLRRQLCKLYRLVLKLQGLGLCLT
jgi:hypothetical protein